MPSSFCSFPPHVALTGTLRRRPGTASGYHTGTSGQAGLSGATGPSVPGRSASSRGYNSRTGQYSDAYGGIHQTPQPHHQLQQHTRHQQQQQQQQQQQYYDDGYGQSGYGQQDYYDERGKEISIPKKILNFDLVLGGLCPGKMVKWVP